MVHVQSQGTTLKGITQIAPVINNVLESLLLGFKKKKRTLDPVKFVLPQPMIISSNLFHSPIPPSYLLHAPFFLALLLFLLSFPLLPPPYYLLLGNHSRFQQHVKGNFSFADFRAKLRGPGLPQIKDCCPSKNMSCFFPESYWLKRKRWILEGGQSLKLEDKVVNLCSSESARAKI